MKWATNRQVDKNLMFRFVTENAKANDHVHANTITKTKPNRTNATLKRAVLSVS